MQYTENEFFIFPIRKQALKKMHFFCSAEIIFSFKKWKPRCYILVAFSATLVLVWGP